MKKSRIGQNTKANHHAYIGDADIGRKAILGQALLLVTMMVKTNIKLKLVTRFIGSNSSLVAPLKVGKKSYVAAGSVVTSYVPAGSLSFVRANQKNKTNWKKK